MFTNLPKEPNCEVYARRPTPREQTCETQTSETRRWDLDGGAPRGCVTLMNVRWSARDSQASVGTFVSSRKKVSWVTWAFKLVGMYYDLFLRGLCIMMMFPGVRSGFARMNCFLTVDSVLVPVVRVKSCPEHAVTAGLPGPFRRRASRSCAPISVFQY